MKQWLCCGWGNCVWMQPAYQSFCVIIRKNRACSTSFSAQFFRFFGCLPSDCCPPTKNSSGKVEHTTPNPTSKAAKSLRFLPFWLLICGLTLHNFCRAQCELSPKTYPSEFLGNTNVFAFTNKQWVSNLPATSSKQTALCIYETIHKEQANLSKIMINRQQSSSSFDSFMSSSTKPQLPFFHSSISSFVR